VIILLSVIWTRGLTSGLKAAVTVFIVLTLLIGLAGHGIYRILQIARGYESPSAASSSLDSC
jgi:hypothetical protein